MNLPNMMEAKKRSNKKVDIVYDDYNNSDIDNIGTGKKYMILTYGCQMNVHDSENISGIMEDLGYLKTEVMEDSNVIIVNTCAIRENAHNKAEGMLGRIKHFKEEHDDVIVIFCGCMAQEEGLVNKIKDYKWIDIICGTHNYHKIPEYLYEYMNTKEDVREVFSIEGNVYENIPVKRDSKYSAWVNIQYGCDKFCTYCIVPYTRGKQRSRKSTEIIKEVEDLVQQGYKEVTLLGQNVNAYGKDLENELSFAQLLQKVSDTGIPRIRFVTSHPWDFTDEMIKTIAECENIMPYIHLPLQAGSSRILKLMGRRYTKEEYLELFNKIKNTIPDVAITTDIIVGFPNETDEDFAETIDVVNKCHFDSAYTFIYSPREGTPAAKMPDAIDQATKEQRLQELNKIINNYSLETNKKYLNKTVKVLIEGKSEKDTNKLFGYTETMKLVNVEGPESLIGNIVEVEITDAKSFSLDGKAK